MKKLLATIILATLLFSWISLTNADELTDLLTNTKTKTSTGWTVVSSGTLVATSSTWVSTTDTSSIVPTSTSNDVINSLTSVPQVTTPVNINVSNGSWKQTIADSNIIIFFKVKKDIPVTSLFTVAYINDLQMTTTVKWTDIKNFFDISTVRSDGSELTLASWELKTLKAWDELKVNLVKNAPLLNKELTFIAPSSITPDRYGILDTTSGTAQIKVLGQYIQMSSPTWLTNIDSQWDMVSADTGSLVTNDVIPNTQTGAKENVLMLLMAVILVWAMWYARNKKSV